jgi:tRNA threonylcarbamoyl adenosine modification protein YeaZ
MQAQRETRVVLGLDTGSPLVSVAAVSGQTLLAERAIELRRSSERLIGLVDEVLTEARATPASIVGVVALRGPGSFTGLRVGLATALALRQGLGCRAAAPSTLVVLAAWAARVRGVAACRAVVQGIRGEWFCQSFEDAPASPVPRATSPVTRRSAQELLGAGPPLVGFGVDSLSAGRTRAHEPGPLAGAGALLAANDAWRWEEAGLLEPLYLTSPSTTAPRHETSP